MEGELPNGSGCWQGRGSSAGLWHQSWARKNVDTQGVVAMHNQKWALHEMKVLGDLIEKVRVGQL